jgi:hypothetical protein
LSSRRSHGRSLREDERGHEPTLTSSSTQHFALDASWVADASPARGENPRAPLRAEERDRRCQRRTPSRRPSVRDATWRSAGALQEGLRGSRLRPPWQPEPERCSGSGSPSATARTRSVTVAARGAGEVEAEREAREPDHKQTAAPMIAAAGTWAPGAAARPWSSAVLAPVTQKSASPAASSTSIGPPIRLRSGWARRVTRPARRRRRQGNASHGWWRAGRRSAGRG